MAETITVSREQWDKIVSGLRILASIPIAHVKHRGDDHPIFSVADTIIRVGHVREARSAIASMTTGSKESGAK